MVRIKNNVMAVSFSELKYGWSFSDQVLHNPRSKVMMADRRADRCAELYRLRTNKWVRRFDKTRDNACLDHAKFTNRRAL
jgi:hypothetical protein